MVIKEILKLTHISVTIFFIALAGRETNKYGWSRTVTPF